MTALGAGDRWLQGEKPEGVHFAHHDRVTIMEGPRDGDEGTIVLLVALSPEPMYLVQPDEGGREVRVRQSALQAAPERSDEASTG